MRAEKIAALRASLVKPGLEEASIRIPLGHAAADLCLKGGLERGVLHEVFAGTWPRSGGNGFCSRSRRPRDLTQTPAVDSPGFFRLRIRRAFGNRFS